VGSTSHDSAHSYGRKQGTSSQLPPELLESASVVFALLVANAPPALLFTPVVPVPLVWALPVALLLAPPLLGPASLPVLLVPLSVPPVPVLPLPVEAWSVPLSSPELAQPISANQVMVKAAFPKM